MAIVILSHTVADYATWKNIYSQDSARRDAAELKEVICGQKSDDPNKVYVVWETDAPEAIDKMFNDPELAAKLQEAGVTSKPDIVIVQ